VIPWKAGRGILYTKNAIVSFIGMENEVTAKELGEAIWIAAGCLLLVLITMGFFFIIDLRKQILRILKRLNGLIKFEEYGKKE